MSIVFCYISIQSLVMRIIITIVSILVVIVVTVSICIGFMGPRVQRECRCLTARPPCA